ncbi:hypothetical protein AJ87_08100 [Rhizobium yanglingense]|nr:hypothetical protein AJ87_08100 [Rhizobium yanglingense]
MQQLAQFLASTGRRLRTIGKVICHFFRKGKLGLKLAFKIPFFVEVELSFETGWNRPQNALGPASVGLVSFRYQDRRPVSALSFLRP